MGLMCAFLPPADWNALAAYLKQVPQSVYQGLPDLSRIASSYATTSSSTSPSVSGRRMLSAAPPSAGCSARSEMTIYFAFPKSTDDQQWNKVTPQIVV